MIATENAIEALRASGLQQWKTVYSPHGTGLYLRLKAAGGKQWFYRYQLNGRRNQMLIGQYPEMSLFDAQMQHGKLAEQVKGGLDVLAIQKQEKVKVERQAKKERLGTMTNEDLFADWLVSYTHRPSEKTRRPPTAKTVARTQYRWDRYVSREFKRQTPSNTARHDVNKMISAAAKRSPEESRKLFTNINMMFEYGEEIGLIDDRPTIGIRAARLGATSSKPAERFLSLKEVGAVLNYLLRHTGIKGNDPHAAPTRTSEIMCLCLIFAFYTGQRRADVYSVRWRDIDFKNRLWTIPAEQFKSRREHQIHLNDTAIEVLKRAMILGESGTGFVFDTGRYVSEETRRPDALNRALGRILKRKDLGMTIKHFSPHDVRRTFATLAGEHLEYPQELIKKTLGQLPEDRLVLIYQKGKQWNKQIEVWNGIGELYDGVLE
ncbi:tyrosine-type recombinase/integrase [Cobetia sp. SIMBA_158]|uniref:tyrosine-type recombinase/integrase n=1 Tax=Cobetia sp. SIMBA_158 TaxID=3081617 RepID=UPI00397FC6A2